MYPECLNPEKWTTDQAGLDAFCDQKCSDSGNWGSNKPNPLWDNWIDTDADGIPDLPGAAERLWSCNPSDNAAILSTVVDDFACVPTDDGSILSYGDMLDQVPTHKGTFTIDASPNHPDGVLLSIADNDVFPAVELKTSFALDQCDSAGVNGGTCRVLLTAFDFGIVSTFSSGDYEVIDVSMQLSYRIAADVTFASCVDDECVGTFEFSNTNGSAITLDLEWTQLDQSTSPPAESEGWLHLGNDGTSLGSVDALYGEITLDPTAESGALRLVGSGADAFGGAVASISFDVIGGVVPW